MTAAGDRRSHIVWMVLVLGLAATSAGIAVGCSACRPQEKRAGEDSPGAPDRGAGGRGTDDRRPARTPAKCGSAQVWDVDGDSISDSLETSNRPFYGFDTNVCDRDPSSAAGKPASGALVRGVNLTDRGRGYVHLRGTDRPDTDDWATLPLLSCIEAVGREAEALDLRLTINDLSRRGGGQFVPHSSHQNGLDVDVRYVRRDGRVAPLDIRRSPDDYDAITTLTLLQAFLRHCSVSTIFVDLASLTFTNEELDRPVLVQAPGHSNHFHVRLRRPS